MKADNNQGDLFKQPISPVVGNAVPGVPSGAVRKRRGRRIYRTAAFGGRNAGDGVPYMEIPDRQKARHCEEGAARRGNPVDFQTFPFQETVFFYLRDCHASVRTGSQ